MKIGLISEALPYLPAQDGFRITAGNLVRCLARRHHLDLISFLQEGDAERLDGIPRQCASVTTIPLKRESLPVRATSALFAYLRGRPLHYQAQVRELLKSGLAFSRWDVLHVEGAAAGGLVPPELAVAKVLSLHDSLALRREEMLKFHSRPVEKLYYAALRSLESRYERLLCPRFERSVVVAERDAEALRKTVPNGKVAVIPDGVDTQYFRPQAVPKQAGMLVFHGSLNYAPNIEAVLEFADHIFPLIQIEVPRATFHVVGANPSSKIAELRSRPGITLSANLPDLRALLCSGQVYVCALRYGTGMKGKVLEAMAMRLPIVCYPESLLGIEAVAGEHLSVARDRDDFARNVVELFRHPEQAERLARRGRELVEKEYSWESRAQAYEELYEAAIRERRSRDQTKIGSECMSDQLGRSALGATPEH